MNLFSNIHNKSDEHKKRFAFLVSGGITLFIFAVWSLAHFGNTEVVAENTQEVGPLESFQANVSGSWESLKKSFDDLTSSTINYGK